MNNGQLDISTIIIAVVSAIIGAILFSVGNRKNKRALRMLGIGFFLGAGVSLFVKSTELREILTAVAVVFAVIIAAFSIDESRRLRQDSIERESRDRKERLYDEVTKWLRELEIRIFPKLDTIKSVTEDILKRNSVIPQETWHHLDELDHTLVQINSLSEGVKEAKYYQKLTLKLNKELGSLIEVVLNNLEQRKQLVVEDAESPTDYGEIIHKIREGTLGKEVNKEYQLTKDLIENDDRPLEGLDLSEQAIIHVQLARNAGAIRKSILNAVDKAIELKASLIKVS